MEFQLRMNYVKKPDSSDAYNFFIFLILDVEEWKFFRSPEINYSYSKVLIFLLINLE